MFHVKQPTTFELADLIGMEVWDKVDSRVMKIKEAWICAKTGMICVALDFNKEIHELTGNGTVRTLAQINAVEAE